MEENILLDAEGVYTTPRTRRLPGNHSALNFSDYLSCFSGRFGNREHETFAAWYVSFARKYNQWVALTSPFTRKYLSLFCYNFETALYKKDKASIARIFKEVMAEGLFDVVSKDWQEDPILEGTLLEPQEKLIIKLFI